MSGDPADVGGTPEDLARIRDEIKDIFAGGVGVDHVAGGRVADALGLAGRARGVEQEEHVLAVHGLARAFVARVACPFVPVVIASVVPGDLVVTPAQRQDMADLVPLLGEGLARGIDIVLERDDAAATPGAVACQDDPAVGIEHAIDDGAGTEPAEDDRVHGTDPRAGEAGDGQFGDHPHVDGDDLALADAQALQGVGEAGGFERKVAIGESADLRAVCADGLALPDDRRLVAQPVVDLSITAVVTEVGSPGDEPLGVGRVEVEHAIEGPEPVQFAGDLAPEALRIAE